MHSLPVFVKLAGRPVILLGDGEAAEAKRRLLERAGALVVEDHPDARLAIVAIEDEVAARDAVAALKARGLLVNAVDRPALCDFTLPAIVDRDPVLVAIGTGGVSAGLAAALRQRLEALLPSGLGTLATALFSRRTRLRAAFPDPADRRRALGAALAEGGTLDPLAPRHLAGPKDQGEAVDRWLVRGAAPGGRFARIAVTSPDPDHLTLIEARLLALADRVFCDGAVPPAILARARADAARIPGPLPADAAHLSGISVEIAWRPWEPAADQAAEPAADPAD